MHAGAPNPILGGGAAFEGSGILAKFFDSSLPEHRSVLLKARIVLHLLRKSLHMPASGVACAIAL
jgi:hypothetical protein